MSGYTQAILYGRVQQFMKLVLWLVILRRPKYRTPREKEYIKHDVTHQSFLPWHMEPKDLQPWFLFLRFLPLHSCLRMLELLDELANSCKENTKSNMCFPVRQILYNMKPVSIAEPIHAQCDAFHCIEEHTSDDMDYTYCSVSIGPLSSIGSPITLIILPRVCWPTGILIG